MVKFLEYPSVKKLLQLSSDPFDLSTITPKRLDAMSADALGLKLFYGTQRISEEVLTLLFELAEESGAVEKMRSMQGGGIV